MTLVLPFGPDQIANNPLFSGSSSVRNSSMPCVFDGEPLDFESALMTDWTSDITDYDTSADDFSMKTPSDSNDLKRKVTATGGDSNPSQSKKQRTDNDNLVSPLQSGIVSSSSSSDPHQPCTSSSTSSPFEIQSPLDTSSSSNSSTSSSSSCTSSTSSSSSSSTSTTSSSSDGQEDEASSPAEVDDEEYMPRRRGLQMWNSRQRWKDERKKVLKMSINKLAEIEDPELCLLRSVLINNTIKKLHLDIRNERQAKLRHRQQRMDYFAERFQPLSNMVVGNGSNLPSSSSSDHFSSDFDANVRCNDESNKAGISNNHNSDLYDETSCDEIFGISEDFLRVTIPDRRVSSPIPTSQSCSRDDPRQTDASTSRATAMDSQALCFAHSPSMPSCDTAVDCASSASYPRRTPAPHNSIPSTPNRRIVGPVLSSVANGGSQCATQYRTNRDLVNSSSGEGSFPPRVPILDSVVYHSLLASLESS